MRFLGFSVDFSEIVLQKSANQVKSGINKFKQNSEISFGIFLRNFVEIFFELFFQFFRRMFFRRHVFGRTDVRVGHVALRHVLAVAVEVVQFVVTLTDRRTSVHTMTS